MHPIVLAGATQGRRLVLGGLAHGDDAFPKHQTADSAEQHDVEQRDHQIELAEAAQQRKQPDADRRAHEATAEQHRAELDIDGAAPKMRDRAGYRRGNHLVGAGRHRHDRRNIVEDQERRDQETTANAEHAGKKADGRAHTENDEYVHRQLCDGQIDRHAGSSICQRPAMRANRLVWQAIHHE
ncbi:hypothetical protein D9M68_349150 [compost metagenome]